MSDEPMDGDSRSGQIVTLTLSPALDLSSSVEVIEPWRKMRCGEPTMMPGGGGVNVARAVRQLGGDAIAVVALGGHVGSLLADALGRAGVTMRRIRTRGVTRQNFSVTERASGEQYRFVHSGPPLSASEWKRCVDATVELAHGAACVVASSSVPRGVPDDVFARLAAALGPLGVPLIVDTSGHALAATLGAPVELVKPSVNELRSVAGQPLTCLDDYEQAARKLLAQGECKAMVVSLGADGALFVPRAEDTLVARAPAVRAVSSVGAGDSMVAGLALALTRHASLADAARLGIAAGTAAVMAEGTALCERATVDRLLPRVVVEPLQSF